MSENIEEPFKKPYNDLPPQKKVLAQKVFSSSGACSLKPLAPLEDVSFKCHVEAPLKKTRAPKCAAKVCCAKVCTDEVAINGEGCSCPAHKKQMRYMCPPFFLKAKPFFKSIPKTIESLLWGFFIHVMQGWRFSVVRGWTCSYFGSKSGSPFFLVLEKMDCSSVNRSYDTICISQNYHQLWIIDWFASQLLRFQCLLLLHLVHGGDHRPELTDVGRSPEKVVGFTADPPSFLRPKSRAPRNLWNGLLKNVSSTWAIEKKTPST